MIQSNFWNNEAFGYLVIIPYKADWPTGPSHIRHWEHAFMSQAGFKPQILVLKMMKTIYALPHMGIVAGLFKTQKLCNKNSTMLTLDSGNSSKVIYLTWATTYIRKVFRDWEGLECVPSGLPTCNNYSQMWGNLEPTAVEQQTVPWCAGLPPLECNAAPHQMDDEVPCSTTTTSYHPGMQESIYHLEQTVAKCLLDTVMLVLDIYLKQIVG